MQERMRRIAQERCAACGTGFGPWKPIVRYGRRSGGSGARVYLVMKTLFPSRPRGVASDLDQNPCDLTMQSLVAWPTAELVRLLRAGAAELKRRREPQPVALPIAEVMTTVFGEGAIV